MNKYLPIGTVVLLKDANKKLMIIGYLGETNNKTYDYIGCMYPEGVLNTSESILFNHVDIDKIFYDGFISDEYKNLNNKIIEYMNR